MEGVQHVGQRGTHLQESRSPSVREYVIGSRKDQITRALSGPSTAHDPVHRLVGQTCVRVGRTGTQSSCDVGDLHIRLVAAGEESASVADSRHIEGGIEIWERQAKFGAVGAGKRGGGQNRRGFESGIERHLAHGVGTTQHSQRRATQAAGARQKKLATREHAHPPRSQRGAGVDGDLHLPGEDVGAASVVVERVVEDDCAYIAGG